MAPLLPSYSLLTPEPFRRFQPMGARPGDPVGQPAVMTTSAADASIVK